jgi:thiol reductant ABC exporter CydC subunit
MTVEGRLLRLAAPVRGDLVLGAALAGATLVAGIALVASAAYLLSRAALVEAFVDVAVLVTAVRAFAIGRAALRYGERYVTHRATLRLLARMRGWTFAAIEPLAPLATNQRRSGDMLARLGSDADRVGGFYLRGLVPVAAAAVAAIAGVALLVVIAPTTAVVLVIGLVLGGVVLPPIARRAARPIAARTVDGRGRLHAAVADEITGTAELVAFEAGGSLGVHAVGLTADLGRLERRAALHRGSVDALGGFIAAATALLVVVAGASLVAAGRLEGVVLAALPLAVLATFEGIGPLAGAMEERETARAAATRVFELVDMQPPVADPSSPAAPPIASDLELRDITVRYAADLPAVFTGWSLSVAQGERVAVVGPSGRGKTTIANLLVRFLDPERGTIRIGGADIATCRSDDIRARIGVVPQHPYLFHGTIRDNLLVAHGDATDEELVRAARIAGLGAFIDGLPAGLDTVVGEDGLRLSSGERQRVAIARMVLKDAPIVILDEATAHLDSATETAILARLDRWLEGRTTVVLAHRPALAALADRQVTLPG